MNIVKQLKWWSPPYSEVEKKFYMGPSDVKAHRHDLKHLMKTENQKSTREEVAIFPPNEENDSVIWQLMQGP